MTEAFAAVFETLREDFRVYEAISVVLHDEPARYYLGTHEVRQDGYRMWLGGLEIKKTYVSVHMLPVYVHPHLADGISPQLAKRRQGKACFNFKAMPDDGLREELRRLLAAGVAQFKADGRL